jgi:hypothetical protein
MSQYAWWPAASSAALKRLSTTGEQDLTGAALPQVYHCRATGLEIRLRALNGRGQPPGNVECRSGIESNAVAARQNYGARACC